LSYAPVAFDREALESRRPGPNVKIWATSLSVSRGFPSKATGRASMAAGPTSACHASACSSA